MKFKKFVFLLLFLIAGCRYLIEASDYNNVVTEEAQKARLQRGATQSAWAHFLDSKFTYDGDLSVNERILNYYPSGAVKIKLISTSGENDKLLVFYEDGRIKDEAELIEGLNYMFAKSYNSSGHLTASGYLRNGKPEGTFFRYTEKGFYAKMEFKNGMLNGQGIIYYPSGEPFIVIPYKDNMKEGRGVLYDKKGRLMGEEDYHLDRRSGIIRLYYPSGKLFIEGQVRDDIPFGKIKIYDANGGMKYISVEELKEKHKLNSKFDNLFKRSPLEGFSF
ncbi:MAG: toxin-antitoxin system YwqK family antitoxin [Alphaproteobacteria bacterium]|nr:toxin-antitoxin system YwqK family antitoxin [Alphaproteobacteria bacterium]